MSNSKPDPRQTSMLPDLARKIGVDGNISEPRLWFKELRLLRHLTTDESDANLIRKFSFRRGLNILWAEPEAPSTQADLYMDGFSGHATGKTLFCRIMRFLLDDINCGTADTRQAIADKFDELWAVACIRLNQRSWIIGRPLVGDLIAFAVPDCDDINEALSNQSLKKAYKLFSNALESNCGDRVSQLHPTEGWRNLLPWLARDQEARFAGVTSWRDALSEADSPQIGVQDRHMILRVVLNLLDKEEYDLRKQISDFEQVVANADQGLSRDRPIHELRINNVRDALSKIPETTVDLADLKAAKGQVAAERERREAAVSQLAKNPESEKVSVAREEHSVASFKLNEAKARIETLDKEIPNLETQNVLFATNVRKIEESGINDPTRACHNLCPNSLKYAQDHGCVPKGEADKESLGNLAELKQLAKAQGITIQGKKDEKARLESAIDQLEADIVAKKQSLTAAINAEGNPAAKLERMISFLETTEDLLDQAIKSSESINETVARQNTAREQLSKAKETLERVRHEAETRLQNFSQVYADVIGAVLGASVSASVTMSDSGKLLLRAERNGNMGGAALESIKTVAFDIASMVFSMEGQCSHPRFLIHDGPREADMARVVYERFFFYARHMEDSFHDNEASFQYIISTTTPPPTDMSQGSRWLLCEPLSGKDKSKRLLKEDF